ATTALRDSTLDAVWLPPASAAVAQGGPTPVARLFTASALGIGPTQLITQVLTSAGKAEGATTTVTDVVPLPAHDPFGISSFFFSVAVFLPTFLGAMVLALLLRRTPWVAMAVGIVVLAGSVGVIDVAVADGALGALTGHSGALIGIAALTSFAVSAPTAALGRAWGPVGALLAVLVFVVLGLPASGGPFGSAFLPAFHRVVSPVLPLTNAVSAVRNTSYFHGHAVSGHLRTLTIWALGGAFVLAVMAVLEASRRSTQARGSIPEGRATAVSDAR
ncbi:MAG TPA: hypothetical protein VMU14_10285, partial [Acidimicrobiales bacterium]|nr:hypothetical protein [Acidimicrobiales bacterium]